MWLKIEVASVHPPSPQRNTRVETKVRRRMLLEKGGGHPWFVSLQSLHLHPYSHSTMEREGACFSHLRENEGHFRVIIDTTSLAYPTPTRGPPVVQQLN